MSRYDKLKEEGLELLKPNKPNGNFIPVCCNGKMLFSAGNTPKIDGVLQFTGHIHAGEEKKGYDAARLCALNFLSVLEAFAGGLDNVERFVRITGYVNSDPEFTNQSAVVDGASDLIVSIFGDAGKHARSSIGVATLGGSAVCEILFDVILKDESKVSF